MNRLHRLAIAMSSSINPTTSTSTPLAPRRIVVIGGSLSGLFAAVPLLRLGHRVTILERSPTPLLHDQGAGIVAGGETLSWFTRHDLFRRDVSVRSEARLYLDRAGDVIDREDWVQRMTSWDLVWNLGRANFDGQGAQGYVAEEDWGRVMALEEVRGQWDRARYEYGREVVGIDEVGDAVNVRWVSTREGEDGREGKEEADFVVVADGPSSHLRGTLLGSDVAAKRTYAGYVAFRGTVREAALSATAEEVFVEKFTFFHAPNGVQILAYTIPGPEGTLEKGQRLVNWVWYWNQREESDEYGDLMTDSDGARHRFTLPTGGKSKYPLTVFRYQDLALPVIPHSSYRDSALSWPLVLTISVQSQVWDRQIQRAAEILPPQFAEIVSKTDKPFVQAITDVKPPSRDTKVGRLLNGQAALVGDALAGFRPHTAASTSQAAFDALLLERVFAGELSWDEYEAQVLSFAQAWQTRGVMLGNRSQFGSHPLSEGAAKQPVARSELHMRRPQ